MAVKSLAGRGSQELSPALCAVIGDSLFVYLVCAVFFHLIKLNYAPTSFVHPVCATTSVSELWLFLFFCFFFKGWGLGRLLLRRPSRNRRQHWPLCCGCITVADGSGPLLLGRFGCLSSVPRMRGCVCGRDRAADRRGTIKMHRR